MNRDRARESIPFRFLPVDKAAATRWVRVCCCAGGLRGRCGFDLFELGFVEAFGFPEVELALGV